MNLFDKLKEECGVFGICRNIDSDVARLTYLALFALQHRGQESCGIAVNKDGIIKLHRDSGLVPDVFDAQTLEHLGTGEMAVGHTRYATKDVQGRQYAQPLLIRHIKGPMALCHNGNIVNAQSLRSEFELKGNVFHTTSDAELIAYAITHERLSAESIEAAIEAAMYKLKGAYSLVIMSPRKLIAVRDPSGFRPLCIGSLDDGSFVFASETCALDTLGAKYVRDVEPGEIVITSPGEGLRSITTHCGAEKRGSCVFEFVYFARPDSVIDGASVHMARQNAGKFLAQDAPADADVVIGVPDSGLDAALGFSIESGIPYGVGFIKNRYIGRTFIQPTQNQREAAVKIKLNALAATVSGKRVVLIDDSIVRGTTISIIIKLLRQAGATEVHVRVASPPFTHPCYFGTDVDSRGSLIANGHSIEDITKAIDADSLAYLKLDAVKKIAQTRSGDFCVGCFTGEYPIEVQEEAPKDKFKTGITARGIQD